MEQHLTLAMMRLLLSGEVPAGQQPHWEAHCASCLECRARKQAIVDELAAEVPEMPAYLLAMANKMPPAHGDLSSPLAAGDIRNTRDVLADSVPADTPLVLLLDVHKEEPRNCLALPISREISMAGKDDILLDSKLTGLQDAIAVQCWNPVTCAPDSLVARIGGVSTRTLRMIREGYLCMLADKPLPAALPRGKARGAAIAAFRRGELQALHPLVSAYNSRTERVLAATKPVQTDDGFLREMLKNFPGIIETIAHTMPAAAASGGPGEHQVWMHQHNSHWEVATHIDTRPFLSVTVKIKAKPVLRAGRRAVIGRQVCRKMPFVWRFVLKKGTLYRLTLQGCKAAV
ncbi:MAG TPA: hypothetical protein PKM88_05160, partial [bacterium]|nr:hypothetical protein [bacterium]